MGKCCLLLTIFDNFKFLQKSTLSWPFSSKLYHWGHSTAHLFKINPSRIVCYNRNVFIKFQNRLIIKREWIIEFSSIPPSIYEWTHKLQFSVKLEILKMNSQIPKVRLFRRKLVDTKSSRYIIQKLMVHSVFDLVK